MAIITNTDTTYAIGVTGAGAIREDLSDLISNISPTDTVFMNTVGKTSADNVKFEWQTDSLRAAAANAQLEADDLGSTFDAITQTTRLNNYLQISRVSVIVGGTAEAVDKAGMKSALSYQIVKKTKELKRDMEFVLLSNQASTAGTAGGARTTGGVPAWIATNNDKSGSNGGFSSGVVAVRTDGTVRALTESSVKSVLRQCYVSGGTPDLFMLGPFNKQVASGFNAGVTTFQDTSDRKLVATVDVYRHEYGTIKIVPNRFQRERDGLVLETDKWKVAYLRPVQVQKLAKTGDAEKRMIITEYGLMSLNEAASGIVADLTTN
jgi:hypothetical protein